MLRIVIQTCDYGAAIHLGGQVVTSLKSFDVDLPEVEAFLRQYTDVECESHWFKRSVVGIEVVDEKANP